MAKDRTFSDAKQVAIENLEEIQNNLVRCTQEGMIDLQSEHYNQLLLFMDEAHISKTWDELVEVISKAKTLEIEIAAWLSGHGQTSISLPWPKKPKKIP